MSKAILVVGGVISGGSKVRMAFKKLHSAATSYLRPVTDRENLTVVTEAQVAARLDAGTVWVNKHLDMQQDTPVGGAKHSGIGVELGSEGLGEYTQTTFINAAI